MAKVKDEGEGMYSFYCPGCDFLHVYYVNSPHWKGGKGGWTFNGDMERPSFNPSLLNRTGIHADPNWDPGLEDGKDRTKPPYSTICHLYVTDGVINYCNDCTHHLNGKRGVEMRDI